MIAADTDLDALFKRLHLANGRRVWRALIDRAERERWSYRDFLTLLVTEEIAHRQQTRLARLTRRAHFPYLKTIDDFNFTYQSSLRLQMLGSALSADFVTEGRSLILAGKPGRGKTHLAIAVAYRAIQNGFDAFFTTAAALIDDLSAAFRAGELANALPTYIHPAVLVVDEVGYLTYGTDAANMLFHVVNERHRRQRSMIFTTNKSLKAWGRVLHDDDLAQAIIDRVLERGRLLRLDGPSVRTLHVNLDDAMKEDSDQQADLIRISGKRWSEYPEPTRARVWSGAAMAVPVVVWYAVNQTFDVATAGRLQWGEFAPSLLVRAKQSVVGLPWLLATTRGSLHLVASGLVLATALAARSMDRNTPDWTAVRTLLVVGTLSVCFLIALTALTNPVDLLGGRFLLHLVPLIAVLVGVIGATDTTHVTRRLALATVVFLLSVQSARVARLVIDGSSDAWGPVVPLQSRLTATAQRGPNDVTPPDFPWVRRGLPCEP